tara:strand:- start:250 stop:429 length:180 start_codon:yes stop_codon:yes gene_type:complete
MPSIIFTNFDGQSLEIDLSKTNNLDALKQCCEHLDLWKTIKKNKNKQTNHVQNKTNRRD